MCSKVGSFKVTPHLDCTMDSLGEFKCSKVQTTSQIYEIRLLGGLTWASVSFKTLDNFTVSSSVRPTDTAHPILSDT